MKINKNRDTFPSLINLFSCICCFGDERIAKLYEKFKNLTGKVKGIVVSFIMLNNTQKPRTLNFPDIVEGYARLCN